MRFNTSRYTQDTFFEDSPTRAGLRLAYLFQNILKIIVDRETVDNDHEPTEADRNSVDR